MRIAFDYDRSHQAGKNRQLAGDAVLWSGDPLEVTTVADLVWFAGRAIEMRSRQTELRDRYFERLKSETVAP